MAYDANFSESATFNATFAGNAIDAVSNEVIDIRTAYDGTVYPSAGDAVRSQIEEAMASGGGQPTPVSLAENMTDTDKLYLYVGNEEGYTYGDWYYYNKNTGIWVDSGQYGVGAAGADGYSPTASVTQTETGVEITITDEEGTTTATVENGTATDAQVAAWLDEHPEATTTVQDGSITLPKLASDVINNFANLCTAGEATLNWEQGSIGKAGSSLSSTTRIRTINYLRVDAMIIVHVPSDKQILYRIYSADMNTVVDSGPADFVTGDVVIEADNGCLCRIIAAYTDDATITAAAGSTITATIYHPISMSEVQLLDNITEMIDSIAPYTAEQVQIGSIATAAPYGFNNGYWNNAGTWVGNSTTLISNNARFSVADGKKLHDGDVLVFRVPEGYYAWIYVYNGTTLTASITNTSNVAAWKCSEGELIACTVGYFLTLDAATKKADANFMSQITATAYRAIPQYKNRSTEFERFYVKTNLDWPNISITNTTNAEPTNEVDIKCIIALPESYTANGTPTPLIMFGHGASCQITDDSWYGNNANFLAMIRAFTAAGYAVFDVNNTRDAEDGFSDWGSLPLMTAYIHAWEYIKQNYNVEHRLYLLSDSMGTAANLMMMKWYGSSVIASIMTACRPISAKYRYTTASDDGKKRMLVAYGLEDDSILEDNTFVIPDNTVFTDDKFKGFYHYENVITMNNAPFVFEKFPPCKVMVGTGDTDFLTETRTYYQGLKNAGNFINYREVTGGTHAQMSFLSVGSLKAEAVAWFDRFRYQSD